MSAAKFTEDDIRRNDLPRDVFELVHDLAYDHEGRERFQYRTRAQKILKASSSNAEVLRLREALREIRAAACGEEQVADDDIGGLNWIFKRSSDALRICPECNGARTIMVKAAGAGHSDDLAEYDPCPTCKGTGALAGEE